MIRTQSQLKRGAGDLRRRGYRRCFLRFRRPWCGHLLRRAAGSVTPGFPVRARQAVTMAMASQPNARQFVDMRIMLSACAARSRSQTDEVIRSSVHVDMGHAGIGHGAARVVGREPPYDRSFSAWRCVEIDRSPVAMHRCMMGACDHGTRPARRDNLHRAKLGLDPVQQLACFTIQTRSRNADVIIGRV